MCNRHEIAHIDVSIAINYVIIMINCEICGIGRKRSCLLSKIKRLISTCTYTIESVNIGDEPFRHMAILLCQSLDIFLFHSFASLLRYSLAVVVVVAMSA